MTTEHHPPPRLPFLDHNSEGKDVLLLAVALCSLAGLALVRQYMAPLPLHKRLLAQVTRYV